MELNNAQSIVNEEDLGLWQKDTEGGLVNHPDTAKCWEDPRTIFNQVNIEISLPMMILYQSFTFRMRLH